MPTYVYCVDDGGDGSQTNATQSATTLDWSKADTSFTNLIAYDAAALTNPGNIIYVGSAHNDASTATHTLVSSGNPVVIISADESTSTATYKAGTGDQILYTSGNLVLDGSVTLVGVRVRATGNISFQVDDNEYGGLYSVKLLPGNNAYVGLGSSGGFVKCIDMTIDCTGDTGAASAEVVRASGQANIEIANSTFANVSNRTGVVFSHGGATATYLKVTGTDFSAFGTGCELTTINNNWPFVFLSNCKTVASRVITLTGTASSGCRVEAVNCDVDDTSAPKSDYPAGLDIADRFGTLASTTAVTRSGGGSIESVGSAWLITTTAFATEFSPFHTPWMYGYISTTGSTNFDVYITNDATGDFDNSQVWLEVESMATDGSGKWTLNTDKRVCTDAATTSPGSVSRDDTTSTWSGGAAGFDTCKQRLRVTATVNEDGLYRARVCVGLASIASTRDFYIDPKVTVAAA